RARIVRGCGPGACARAPPGTFRTTPPRDPPARNLLCPSPPGDRTARLPAGARARPHHSVELRVRPMETIVRSPKSPPASREGTGNGGGGRPVIAYFSMEIGLESDLPTYAGGLGVLAGDT